TAQTNLMSGDPAKDKAAFYTYDDLNQKTDEKWVDGPDIWSYEGMWHVNPDGGTRAHQSHWTYDVAGRVLTEQDADVSGGTSTTISAYSYTYDAQGRLSSTDNAGTPEVPRVVIV